MAPVDLQFYRKLTSKQPAWVNIVFFYITNINQFRVGSFQLV